MNKDTAREYLPLVQALADGKVIQEIDRDCVSWLDRKDVEFKHPPRHYRIKPEPREIWMNRYPNGIDFGPYESQQQAHDLRANDTAVQVRYREILE